LGEIRGGRGAGREPMVKTACGHPVPACPLPVEVLVVIFNFFKSFLTNQKQKWLFLFFNFIFNFLLFF
jgi:hypothetical protein